MLHLGEERRRQPGDWIAVSRQCPEKFLKQSAPLRRRAHALPVDGFEAADGVGDWQKSADEDVKPLEVAVRRVIPD